MAKGKKVTELGILNEFLKKSLIESRFTKSSREFKS